ncbi:MAG: VOC family protein [Myxococcales bacterium]|nr:VOC family protein [Myxococcales bacterium]
MEVLSSRVLIRPRDFAASARFYRETVGLAVYREFGSRGLVFFAGGGFLELSGERGPAPGGATQTPFALWLQVRDVRAEHARLAALGVPVDEPPVRKPWGLVEARLRDPDGLLLVLVEIPDDHPLRRDTRRGVSAEGG